MPAPCVTPICVSLSLLAPSPARRVAVVVPFIMLFISIAICEFLLLKYVRARALREFPRGAALPALRRVSFEADAIGFIDCFGRVWDIPMVTSK